MAKGEGGPDPEPAVALAEQTRVYPLWAAEKDVTPMEFPNASGQRVNMMYPVDNTYWTKLKAFVDYEPVTAIDPELRGVLASIGIVKGQPFEPTEAAGAVAAGGRDRAQDDPRAAPARTPRRPQPLLRGPPVGARLGRRHSPSGCRRAIST